MKKYGLSKVLITGALVSCVGLLANPTNPVVVSGNVSFSETMNSLEVTAMSNRSIVDWDTFSIGAQETTNFTLPDTGSAILNRVILSGQSSIMGKITSNGQVYLVNPNGIVISNTASINVSSFLASTLDVLDAEFLAAGNMTFSGSSMQPVTNDGEITAFSGDVFLLGRHVTSSGQIEAFEGVGGLAAGEQIVIRPLDDQKILIVPGVGAPAGTGIDLSGVIKGIRTEIKSDGNLYALAINQTGKINCVGVQTIGGRVILLAEGGTTTLQSSAEIFAKNADSTGGEIRVLGTTVNVLDNTILSASAIEGGGIVYVGGAPGGLDPNIFNATNTTIGQNVEVSANADLFNNGGTISVFATNTADVSGSHTAVGGAVFGDGGSVETSGFVSLIFNADVDTGALRGAVGNLTLDPNNITISDKPTTPPPIEDGTYTGGKSTSNLNIQSLQKSLEKNNILITTSPGSGGEGTVTLASPMLLTSPNGTSLTIHADGDLNVNAPFVFMDATEKGNLASLNFVSGKCINFRDGLLVKNTNKLTMKAQEGIDMIRGNGIKGYIEFNTKESHRNTNITIHPQLGMH